MRVGLLVPGAPGATSGGYLYDRRLADGLQTLGCEVEIIPFPRLPLAAGLAMGALPGLAARIRKTRLDVLLEDELGHSRLLGLNRRLRQDGGPPAIAVVHHLRCREPRAHLLNRLYAQVEQAFLKTADGFVFNSRATEREVMTMAPGPWPSVIARPAGDRLGGLEPACISLRCRREEPLRLLHLGAVIRRKGLDGLLMALRRVPARLWRLTVAGDEEAEPSYARRCRKLAATFPGGQVEFLGTVSDDFLRDLLQEVDALAMPFAYEGFGIASLEAAAFGLPAIASTDGGAPEAVAHEKSGWLVPPGDHETTAAAIAALSIERGFLERLSLGARKRFEEHPTWRDCARMVHGFLEEIVERWRRKRPA